MSRSILQLLNAIVAIATVVLAGMQVLFGVQSPMYGVADLHDPVLDSNLRFFGGMALVLGLTLLWILPAIERRTTLYRLVWACAFLGGIGRVVSWVSIGAPPPRIAAMTVLEVVGAPVFVWWQARIAK